MRKIKNCIAGLVLSMGLVGGCSKGEEADSEFAALSDVEVTFCSHVYGVTGSLLKSLEDEATPLAERLNVAELLDTVTLGNRTEAGILARRDALSVEYHQRLDLEDLIDSAPSGPGILVPFSGAEPVDKEAVLSAAEQKIRDSQAAAEAIYGPLTLDNFLVSLAECDLLIEGPSNG